MMVLGEDSAATALARLYEQFLSSSDTLWVCHEGKPIFQSRKERLQPLLDYIDAFVPRVQGASVFDRVTGNAAALLLKVACCTDVISPLGSELAAKTLAKNAIAWKFGTTVPFITNDAGDDMCPMEKLSLEKTPEEFHVVLRHMAHVSRRPRSKN